METKQASPEFMYEMARRQGHVFFRPGDTLSDGVYRYECKEWGLYWDGVFSVIDGYQGMVERKR